jgi:hypothetical protein
MPSDHALAQKEFYNWPQRLNGKAVRGGIAAVLHATVCSPESCLLKPFSPHDSFVAMLLAYVPRASSLVPQGLVSGDALARAKETLAEFGRDNPDEVPSGDEDTCLAYALLILQSRGVKAVDFGYFGGWDEISYDGADIVWHENALPPELERVFSADPSKRAAFEAELFRHVEDETGITESELFYHFLDDADSGAGDGTIYSQNMLLDMQTLEFVMHDRLEDAE